MSLSDSRPTCYECFRPLSLCYCDQLVRIANRTRIVVLQHPRERFHPLSTARIVERSLINSEIISVLPHQADMLMNSRPELGGAAVVYPAPHATDLSKLRSDQYPQTLIVLDGTWHHAKTFLRRSTFLSQLPAVRFTPECQSEYRIRKEPRADYLSTVESVAWMLKQLEPDTEHLENLRRTFVSMIDRNIALRRPSEGATRFVRPRRLREHRFAPELGSKDTSLVSFYCEGTSRFAPEEDQRRLKRKDREPLVVYAVREHSGASLRFLLKTKRVPPGRLLKNLALNHDNIAQEGIEPEIAREKIEEWLQPDDVIVVANVSSYQILRQLGVQPRAHLILKGSYGDYGRYLACRGDDSRGPSVEQDELRWTGLEEVVARHEMVCQEPLEAGRGPLRLAQTRAVLGWLRAQRKSALAGLSGN